MTAKATPEVSERDTLFDVRTVKRHIAAGRTTSEAWAGFMAELEDCASNAETTTTRMVSGMGQYVREGSGNKGQGSDRA